MQAIEQVSAKEMGNPATSCTETDERIKDVLDQGGFAMHTSLRACQGRKCTLVGLGLTREVSETVREERCVLATWQSFWQMPVTCAASTP